jgi:hypothetical protein
MSRALRQRSDDLYEIPVDDFIRGMAARDGGLTDLDYEGDFGDDDDLSDQTPENVYGCHSLLVNDIPELSSHDYFDVKEPRPKPRLH